MRFLLVEDDRLLGSAIERHVGDLGHGIDWVSSLEDANAAIDTVAYDIIFLDLNLPDGTGIRFLNECRSKNKRTPIIITSAQDQLQLRIDALKAGADDFLVKPFDLDELVARAEVILRRSTNLQLGISTEVTVKDVTIDIGRKRVIRAETEVQLTAKEWVVLDCLIRNKGAVVPKSAIEDSLYSFDSAVESNAVEVFVSRIRKKLGSQTIKTVRGIGYLLGASQ